MRFFVYLILATHAAAAYVTKPVEKPMATRLIATSTSDIKSQPVVVESTSLSPPPSITFSSLVTIAPLSRNPLELRQHCWNDQGFSVDCATWTGYYYTWGGAGHPYAGGPGEGGGSGGGGGSSNNAITGILGAANRLEGLKIPSLAALMTVCLLLLL